MIISCLGDSLTEGDYGIFGKRGIGNVHAENYPYFLSKLTDAEVRNYGKCGYRSSTYLAHYEAGHADVSGSDVILIMLGTNGGQHPTDLAAPENQCYHELIEHCKADAPHAKIILCTPPHVTVDPAFSNCGYAPRVADAVEFVRLYAKTYDMPLIDVAAYPEFCAENEKRYQANDGLHFVEEGYRVLAAFVAEELQKYL